MSLGYVDTPVSNTYRIAVDETHELFVEECGNPKGIPVLFLHGGPGGSVSEKSRRFFDPEQYRIILFDQRGTGNSTPFLSLENNTPFDSVEDIEKIRTFLNINQWIIFGGSYGSTLALTYAIHYPGHVLHLVLRGIFLGRLEDIDWLFNGGTGQFFPEEFERFRDHIPEEQQADLVTAYYDRMISGTTKERDLASKSWSDWESGLTTIIPSFSDHNKIEKGDLSLGLLEAHYFANRMFWDDDNYILNHIDALNGLSMDIVHGRLDVDCRVKGAYELAQAYPTANLHIIEGGAHSPFEKPMMQSLLNIMDHLPTIYS